jgi:predicted Fe-Mo cluster-binding NifX family protein
MKKNTMNSRLAVASTDGKYVDLHFGDADQFFIFEINEGKAQFKEVRYKNDVPVQKHKDRWVTSLKIVEDCRTVICNKIGAEPNIILRKMGKKVVQLESEVEYAVYQCSKHMISN